MSFTMQQLPGEPIILVVCDAAYDAVKEGNDLADRLVKLLDGAAEPVFTVHDIHAMALDMDGLVQGSSISLRFPNHPHMREAVFVTSNPAIKAALKGLDSDIFKHQKMAAFDTVEEALAYVRERLKA